MRAPGLALFETRDLGLAEVPDLWRWSSFRAYAYQEAGLVRLNRWSVPARKFIEATTFSHSSVAPTRVSKTTTRGSSVGG